MSTKSHLLFPAALGKSLTMLKPHWAKAQGLERALRVPPGWWMFGANLLHWSHFFTYSYAPFCITDHQYPWVRAMWDSDLPPVWLPQIPSCNSSKRSSIASGWTHNRYSLKKERLYNFWSSNNQKQWAFLRTLSASPFSLGKMSSLRNITMGSIQLGHTLI